MSHGYTVEDNLKLVMKIAHRYDNRIETEFDDIFQEGCIGLMRAVKEYDPNKGVSFSAFAAQHITFAILRHLTTIDVIRKSHHVISNANRIMKAGIRDEPIPVISKKMGISIKETKTALSHLNEVFLSSEMPVSTKNGRELTIAETLVSDYSDQFDEVVNSLFLNDQLDLKEDEKVMINYIMEGYTLKEIAEMMNYVSVNALCERLRRLRKRMKEKKHFIL